MSGRDVLAVRCATRAFGWVARMLPPGLRSRDGRAIAADFEAGGPRMRLGVARGVVHALVRSVADLVMRLPPFAAVNAVLLRPLPRSIPARTRIIVMCWSAT